MTTPSTPQKSGFLAPIALLGLLLLLMGSFLYRQHRSLQAEIQRLRQEVAEREKTVGKLEEVLEDTESLENIRNELQQALEAAEEMRKNQQELPEKFREIERSLAAGGLPSPDGRPDEPGETSESVSPQKTPTAGVADLVEPNGQR